MRGNTLKLTESAVLCALYLVLLLAGLLPGFIHVAIFIAIASLTLIQKLYGNKQWTTCYIAASILGLILIPDLEVSLTCVCMGWYPYVRDKIKNLRKPIKIIVKTVVFTIASTIIYYISIAVFGSDEIVENIPYFIVLYDTMFITLFYMLDIHLLLADKLAPRIIKIRNRIFNYN